MNAIAGWWRERFPVSPEQIRELTNEPVPNHLKRWWFCLGGTPMILFALQVFTGILLAIYYQPSPLTAWESVRYITEEASYGWYIRGLHKWGATFMIAAVILHQMRVFFTGAYRRPRELNWIIGMGLLVCTLLTGFTGYSLVYEQLSYWGATVGANIADNIPVLGPIAKQVLLGGEVYNDRTLARFFILHAAVLPVLIVGLVTVHLVLIRTQGVTEFQFPDEKPEAKKTFNFFPDHFYTELIIALVLSIVLTVLASVQPPHLGPPADPLTTPEVIKPEWFFYVAFRWLKLFSGPTAVFSMGLIVAIMVAWPFIDGAIRRRSRFQEASVYIGILAVLAIIALTLWEALVEH